MRIGLALACLIASSAAGVCRAAEPASAPGPAVDTLQAPGNPARETGGVRPLGPGGKAGSWDDAPRPEYQQPVRNLCEIYLRGRDHDTRFVGKTTAYLSAGWAGGAGLGWFSESRGGGPMSGAGAYRDWGKSTVRAVPEDSGCFLDTRDEGSQWRLQGGWNSAIWSKYNRLDFGAAFVLRPHADLGIAAGLDLLAHGTGTSDWALAAAPDVRVTYNDWVGVGSRLSLGFAGRGVFKDRSPQLLIELFMSERFKSNHFP